MSTLTIKLATEQDSSQLARLAGQLGYPSSAEQVVTRLVRIHSQPDQAIFIAEVDGRIAGWVHIYACPTVESELYTEIGGLVVDENSRGQGVGKALMVQAETWSRELGIHKVRLRSNILRQEAHQFYEAIGYKKIKSQYTFHKTIR